MKDLYYYHITHHLFTEHFRQKQMEKRGTPCKNALPPSMSRKPIAPNPRRSRITSAPLSADPPRKPARSYGKITMMWDFLLVSEVTAS
ncbi:hypothetical protein GCK32_011029 [Trichostrongylus colubriformis]|uniref:Uncharacterized protein n=1 Tax=Trichostrongylus colubriformis TaxID=6319 RepID=A0AAN8IW89_TRICO